MQSIKHMFELISHPVWIKDEDDKIIFLNPEFKITFNIDTSIEKYNIKKILNNNLELKSLFDSIFIAKDKDSNIINIDNKIYKQIVFLYKDKSKYLVGMLIDITETKQTHDSNYQRDILKTVIDNIPEIIFHKDNNLRYIGLNKECENFYKERGVNDIIGKTDIDLPLDSNFVNSCSKHDKMVLNTKQPVYIEEILPSKDGKNYGTALTIKTPILGENNNILGLVGIVRDITEQKKIERKLRYLSYTDGLTKVYNRAYFDEKINEFIYNKQFPIGVISGDINGLKIVNDTLGHIEGDNLLKEISSILSQVCKNKGFVFRWGGDEFITILPRSSKEECVNFIKKVNELCNKKVKENFKLSISQGYSLFEEDNNIYDVLRKSENEAYKKKIFNNQSIRKSILNTLKKNLQMKNIETQEHTKRVSMYCEEIGKALNLNDEEMQKLALVANLHDIGKIGIPDDILLKPSKLSNDEYEIMKTHAEKGYRLALLLPELSHVARGILTHHERWDGSGYPLSLKGNEIPLIARIVSIVDAFDTMTSGRLYSNKKSKTDALKEIKKCAGTQFDPNIVKVFCEIVNDIKDNTFTN